MSEGILTKTTIYEGDRTVAEIIPGRDRGDGPKVRLQSGDKALPFEAETAHLIGRALMEHAEALGVEHDTSEFPGHSKDMNIPE